MNVFLLYFLIIDVQLSAASRLVAVYIPEGVCCSDVKHTLMDFGSAAVSLLSQRGLRFSRLCRQPRDIHS